MGGYWTKHTKRLLKNRLTKSLCFIFTNTNANTDTNRANTKNTKKTVKELVIHFYRAAKDDTQGPLKELETLVYP